MRARARDPYKEACKGCHPLSPLTSGVAPLAPHTKNVGGHRKTAGQRLAAPLAPLAPHVGAVRPQVEKIY